MRISKFSKSFLAVLMSVLMTHLPNVVLAEEMIATNVVVNELSRAEAEANVQKYLDRDDVQIALEKQGLSVDEISKKMASLSDYELNQLSKQMDEARYGGDILLTILVVVLIVFLIKRI